MSAHVIEFVGGPRDGDRMVVPDGDNVVRIMFAPALDWTTWAFTSPETTPALREGRYVRSVEQPTDFVWEGEGE